MILRRGLLALKITAGDIIIENRWERAEILESCFSNPSKKGPASLALRNFYVVQYIGYQSETRNIESVSRITLSG